MEMERLFDRLSYLDLSDDQKRGQVKRDRVLESIRHHLSGLFNTVRGTVLIDADYGLPDMSMGPGSNQVHGVDVMAQILLETINHYEKRLIKPQVKVTLNNADNSSIVFAILATIEEPNEIREVTMTGAVIANGSFVFDPID